MSDDPEVHLQAAANNLTRAIDALRARNDDGDVPARRDARDAYKAVDSALEYCGETPEQLRSYNE